jgi:hypothetical protein
LDGQLTVTYGNQGDDSGVGWEGTLGAADIVEGWSAQPDEMANPEEPSPASVSSFATRTLAEER